MSEKSFVTYEEFGAVGDGVTDDFAAICRAHDYANEKGLPVKVNGEKTYYICNPVVDGEMRTAYIKTDVDWGTAKFIIDDTPISLDDETKPWHGHVVFTAVSDHPKFRIEDEVTLREISEVGITKKSTRLALKLGYPAKIIAYSSGHKVFKRRGYGSWQGSPMHEIIVIDGEGNISEETPIMFDYVGIDYVDVIRLDIKPITIQGGEFTTLANNKNILRRRENGEIYYQGSYIARGIRINRSFTTVKGLKHYIKGEISPGEQVDENGNLVAVMNPASGFYGAFEANHVTFLDCIMSGRRRSELAGSYEISGNAVNKIVFKNCRQINFFVTLDEKHRVHPATEDTPGALTSMSGYKVNGHALMLHWGCGGTNFCKNMEFVDCVLSRFDAHCGLYHGRILNSTINGLEVVGMGKLTLENVRWFARGGQKYSHANNAIFYLRDDYASTWEGEMVLKNVDAYAVSDENCYAYIFTHSYSNWDYGYRAYFPNLYVENLRYFHPETKEPLPSGTEIRLVGNSIDREPLINAEYTANTPSIFPDVDEDGDGLVDGTNIPYDDVVSTRGVVDPTSFKNHNPVVPPKYIKFFGNEGAGYKLIVQDTSEYESGGFFGTTEFISERGTTVGTVENSDPNFEFRKPEINK